jgi:hypothetical protein
VLKFCEVQDERQIDQIFSAVGILGLMGHNLIFNFWIGGNSECMPLIQTTAVYKESSPDEANSHCS